MDPGQLDLGTLGKGAPEAAGKGEGSEETQMTPRAECCLCGIFS